MLRFKQFLIEGFVPRREIKTLFSPENIDPITGSYIFDVYHSGSHDLSQPGSIQTLATVPKTKKAESLWDRIRKPSFGRSDVVTWLRSTQPSEPGTIKWSNRTPSQPRSSTIGFHTTPDPIGAWSYGENSNNIGSLRPDVKITSFKVNVKPEEVMQFNTMNDYEKFIDSLSSDPKVDKNLRAARHFREKGIKAISLKQGTGPTVAETGGEFIVTDPTILKSQRDATVDASDTTADFWKQKHQEWLNKTSNPTTSTKAIGTAAISAAGTALGKTALKMLPVVGTAASLAAMAQRAQAGDYVGAGLEAASELADYIPGVGTAASMGIQGYLADRDMSDEERKEADQKIARQALRSINIHSPRY